MIAFNSVKVVLLKLNGLNNKSVAAILIPYSVQFEGCQDISDKEIMYILVKGICDWGLNMYFHLHIGQGTGGG